MRPLLVVVLLALAARPSLAQGCRDGRTPFTSACHVSGGHGLSLHGVLRVAKWAVPLVVSVTALIVAARRNHPAAAAPPGHHGKPHERDP